MGKLLLCTFLALIGCNVQKDSSSPSEDSVTALNITASNMTITSPAFVEGDSIPVLYTCDGQNSSPRLEIGGAPEATKSFALLADDPDAPGGMAVHWVLYNLPPETRTIPESFPIAQTFDGAVQGLNIRKVHGYTGPCPPPGPAHRYFFRLFAVDTLLGHNPNATRDDLLEALEGHVLAKATLMGKFGREKP